MPFDLSRCPQTEAEALAWFYDGIGRVLGSAANDWEAVMTACGLPPGYGPGVVPNASMPFFAFTQQFSGGPKGRLFLPTSVPDDNGYFTRCIQYLDDAAGTYAKQAKAATKGKPAPEVNFASAKSGGGLVWAWYWVAGMPYSPVTGADSGSVTPPPSSGLTEAEVQAMIDDSLEQALAGVVKHGSRVALRMSGGKVLCAEGGGPERENEPVVLTSRDGVGPWESFTVEEGQG